MVTQSHVGSPGQVRTPLSMAPTLRGGCAASALCPWSQTPPPTAERSSDSILRDGATDPRTLGLSPFSGENLPRNRLALGACLATSSLLATFVNHGYWVETGETNKQEGERECGGGQHWQVIWKEAE